MLVSRSTSKSSSSDNARSQLQILDVESASHVECKNDSPNLCAACKDELKQPLVEVSSGSKGDGDITTEIEQATQLQGKSAKNADLLEALSQARNGKESTSQQSASTSGAVHGKDLSDEQGNKRKKRRTNLDGNVANMQSSSFINIAESCSVYPLLPASYYNPYWTCGGLPGRVDAYMSQFMGNMPYMGFAPGSFDVWSQLGEQMNLYVPQSESSIDRKISKQGMRSRSEASHVRVNSRSISPLSRRNWRG